MQNLNELSNNELEKLIANAEVILKERTHETNVIAKIYDDDFVNAVYKFIDGEW